jgi:15-cis-phytoene synthase
MPPQDAAFASFERKWLEANPEQATVAVFLRPGERRRASAFGSLVHELEQATFGVREPQVAAAKLNWWRQELMAAAAGTSRHPIARELFGDARALAVEHSLWSDLIDGGLVQLETGAAASLDEAFSTLAAFYRPVAALEAVLIGADAEPRDANARLWISSHMLHSVAANPGHERALPLDLLARHGMARADLARPSTRRAALLRDFLAGLSAEIEGALAQATQASLGRRVRARLDLHVTARSAAAPDPAEILAAPVRGRRWRSLWLAWNEARYLARRGPSQPREGSQ